MKEREKQRESGKIIRKIQTKSGIIIIKFNVDRGIESAFRENTKTSASSE